MQQPLNQTQSESSSDYSSDESDDDLEVEEPPAEPSPIPAVRPDDVEGRAGYDTIKVVWAPRNRHAKAADVRNAMIQFSDLVKGVRDTWKARSEALKAAENQNLEGKIPSLKKEVVLQRRLLDLIINNTLEFGHPSYVRRYVLDFLFHLASPISPCRSLSRRIASYVAMLRGTWEIPAPYMPCFIKS